ncbi:uncharacterized protein LOC122508831 [Leptopilina heterotoma]|uniref:uncharacterized protein LOC122508831 n=1 Tax=Leptopilina heterotoma TaxID=63436 RepID=UPI001CAA0E8B|nr:uncharacterized protein LOC122508831 [Leptopilina heterotoma]
MENNNKENNESVGYTCSYCSEEVNIEEPIETHNCFSEVNFLKFSLQSDRTNRLALIEINPNTSTKAATPPKAKKSKLRKVLTDNHIDVILIKEVEARPQLYNRKQKITQAQANVLWQDISNKLGGKYNMKEAKEKWKYLKTTYFRRKKENGVCWQSQYLTFLDPHEDDAEENTLPGDLETHRVDEEIDATEHIPLNSETLETVSMNSKPKSVGSRKRKLGKKTNCDEDGEGTLTELEKAISTFVNESKPLDSTDGFCLMFEELLRQLPEEVRSTVQMKIWMELIKLVEEQRHKSD